MKEQLIIVSQRAHMFWRSPGLTDTDAEATVGCLGKESRCLVQRLEWAELAGEPKQVQSSFVVGVKHLPMRYRIRETTPTTS